MVIGEIKSELPLRDACLELLSRLGSGMDKPHDHAMWQVNLSACSDEILVAVSGLERVAFKSRDHDFEFIGLGAADIVSKDMADVVKKASSLSDGQYYFGAIRFDKNADIAQEWLAFGHKLFLLPMLTVSKKNGCKKLTINYRHDGHVPWPRWLDQVKSLLLAIINFPGSKKPSFHITGGQYQPSPPQYFSTIDKALKELTVDQHHRKVVIGRRRSMGMNNSVDPAQLFLRLKEKSHGAFLFFVDAGFNNAFFGGSPELLYRRNGSEFETESLAGTRPRSENVVDDCRLREELFKSFKDNCEHSLVSMHIEEKLRDFGTTDLFASSLEIMTLSYVQHLLKRYRGTISRQVSDATIIEALHPTPAVCGLDIEWALAFIRSNEGFDRGLYAGPIGFIGKDEAEFAVAIRSALYHDQNLYIYTAGGIVPGSILEQEWEELDNKEKNILGIFDHKD